jgi:hypothetical protein
LNPPVYGYREGDSKFNLIAESFSDFLKILLEEQLTGWDLKA